MTFEEYALKNIQEMKSREPTAQNMRDVALLELWINQKSNQTEFISPTPIAEITKETNDILPAYSLYIENKKKYQLKEITKEKMLDSFENLSNEIIDLINLIYRNTDTPEERKILNDSFKHITF